MIGPMFTRVKRSSKDLDNLRRGKGKRVRYQGPSCRKLSAIFLARYLDWTPDRKETNNPGRSTFAGFVRAALFRMTVAPNYYSKLVWNSKPRGFLIPPKQPANVCYLGEGCGVTRVALNSTR